MSSLSGRFPSLKPVELGPEFQLVLQIRGGDMEGQLGLPNEGYAYPPDLLLKRVGAAKVQTKKLTVPQIAGKPEAYTTIHKGLWGSLLIVHDSFTVFGPAAYPDTPLSRQFWQSISSSDGSDRRTTARFGRSGTSGYCH